MENIIFSGPYGYNNTTISSKELKALLHEDESLWQKGSGDSSIRNEKIGQSLMFFKDPIYGFLILDLSDYTVSNIDKKDDAVIFHKVGGEPFIVPSSAYVCEKKAFEILDYFNTTGEIIKKSDWKDIYMYLGWEAADILFSKEYLSKKIKSNSIIHKISPHELRNK